MLKGTTSPLVRELRALLTHLGLLGGLLVASLLLLMFSTWLSERGGLPLLLLGLTGLWSAVLAAAMLYLAHLKRRRDQAINAALERLRSALHAHAPPKGDADK